MKRCYRCGNEWVSERKQPLFKELCDGCSSYSHCCMNCRFYDEHAHNHCRIPTTEWVTDREGANFCEDFEFADTEIDQVADEVKRTAKEALQTLFEEAGHDPEPKGPDDFKKLFGD